MTDTPDPTASPDPAGASEPKSTEAPTTDATITTPDATDAEPSPAPAAPDATPATLEIKELPKSNPYYWGTGRRKTSVARVRIRPGDGKFIINKKEVDDFFRIDKDRRAVRTPLSATDTHKSIDVFVNVFGGGISGQSGAVVLGLARALVKANQDYEPALRAKNLLSRDPRKVERKKYGQRGARRRFQFSKR